VTSQIQLVAGAVTPVGGGGDYTDDISAGPRFGLQGTAYFGPKRTWDLGAELAADYSRQNWEGAADLDRWRVLIGGRAVYRPVPALELFGRALVGIDRYSGDFAAVVPGEEGMIRLTQSSSAFAGELGLGAQLTFGRFVIGVQADLPVAFYGKPSIETGGPILGGGVEQPVADDALAALAFIDDTTFDLDLLATAGLSF
jgi:hypothetical protein